MSQKRWRRCVGLLVVVGVCAAWCLPGGASEVQLKNGFRIRGNTAPLKSMTSDPKGASPGDPIIVIHDVMRRYYVPRLRIDDFVPGRAEPVEKFSIRQHGKSTAGSPVRTVGPAIRIGKWDEHGRRVFTMSTSRGALDVIQCITLITPKYVQVEAYKNLKWKQYIATTSIPQEKLHLILTKKGINPKLLRDRLRLVRFYLQMERFHVAERELSKLIEEFPEGRADYERTLRGVTQLKARRLLEEITTRAAAGQHRFAYTLLKKFPVEGVAGEILQQRRARIEEYDQQLKQLAAVRARLTKHIQELIAKDTERKDQLDAIRREICGEGNAFGALSILTLDRMAAYQTLVEDPDATLEQKVALAISGWTQGPGGATNNLAVALSLYKVRELIHEYFGAVLKLDRDVILKRLKGQEGATPERVARLLAHMHPPKRTPPAKNGFHEISVEGLGGAEGTYYVQLPPNYDPYRRYPAVITLHGSGTTPEMQIDWWAGGVDEHGTRHGHGSRHGYIVIAPAWGAMHQTAYTFSLREHVGVLHTLRDACRRFSIDTDRVFLSGHSMGGTAAWDIGLAHPDLFAGIIPIVCKCEKYCDLYWKNAKYMPIYYVCGEMDADKLAVSTTSLDRYMSAAYPIIVAEFVGRGHEHFSDEVVRLFDWMSRQRRTFAFRDFACVTKRPWDSFFWWVEMEELPEKTMVLPEDWHKKRGKKGPPFNITGKIAAGNTNTLFVNGGAGRVTVWLTPELVDFTRPLTLSINGVSRRLVGDQLRPSVDVILEDARTRGDRLHPFWAKYVYPDDRRPVVKLGR